MGHIGKQKKVLIRPFDYKSLRNDWYALNSMMPRAVRAAVSGRRCYEFRGFPRQWIPVFEWYGVPWRGSIKPLDYIPFFSDFNETTIRHHVLQARREGVLRLLVESASVHDAVIADFVYIADHTLETGRAAVERERAEISIGMGKRKRPLLLNSWQAYGRPAIRALADRALAVRTDRRVAAVLPCALTRPYDRSKTHRKLYALLAKAGHRVDDLHRVVMTSLGLLPEEVWSEPEVLAYDAGVPDIYRTLRLARAYFKAHRYDLVLDCSQFPPYSDVLSIVQREGLIARLERIVVPKRRTFHVRA